ncbi:hypothetical protein CEUSTIGMA_g8380.t1 [Chlamydomonas eustigma]|uniref:Uncharacterized protein n=1 Tax=Chlamydomonas eustigma TaxID=1157962 RepID=A0A250XCY7_9CHLO|nr:hypothetical protein CEUSTIGMA_g8380.t1 [Chlamydomonas eustigma]|eukprot:GAX80945.1 hypothetical protein CEUSTIGMA_g8380.t1 [Chlamydomonas eustigma]
MNRFVPLVSWDLGKRKCEPPNSNALLTLRDNNNLLSLMFLCDVNSSSAIPASLFPVTSVGKLEATLWMWPQPVSLPSATRLSGLASDQKSAIMYLPWQDHTLKPDSKKLPNAAGTQRLLSCALTATSVLIVSVSGSLSKEPSRKLLMLLSDSLAELHENADATCIPLQVLILIPWSEATVTASAGMASEAQKDSHPSDLSPSSSLTAATLFEQRELSLLPQAMLHSLQSRAEIHVAAVSTWALPSPAWGGPTTGPTTHANNVRNLVPNATHNSSSSAAAFSSSDKNIDQSFSSQALTGPAACGGTQSHHPLLTALLLPPPVALKRSLIIGRGNLATGGDVQPLGSPVTYCTVNAAMHAQVASALKRALDLNDGTCTFSGPWKAGVTQAYLEADSTYSLAECREVAETSWASEAASECFNAYRNRIILGSGADMDNLDKLHKESRQKACQDFLNHVVHARDLMSVTSCYRGLKVKCDEEFEVLRMQLRRRGARQGNYAPVQSRKQYGVTMLGGGGNGSLLGDVIPVSDQEQLLLLPQRTSKQRSSFGGVLALHRAASPAPSLEDPFPAGVQLVPMPPSSTVGGSTPEMASRTAGIGQQPVGGGGDYPKQSDIVGRRQTRQSFTGRLSRDGGAECTAVCGSLPGTGTAPAGDDSARSGEDRWSSLSQYAHHGSVGGGGGGGTGSAGDEESRGNSRSRVSFNSLVSMSTLPKKETPDTVLIDRSLLSHGTRWVLDKPFGSLSSVHLPPRSRLSCNGSSQVAMDNNARRDSTVSRSVVVMSLSPGHDVESNTLDPNVGDQTDSLFQIPAGESPGIYEVSGFRAEVSGFRADEFPCSLNPSPVGTARRRFNPWSESGALTATTTPRDRVASMTEKDMLQSHTSRFISAPQNGEQEFHIAAGRRKGSTARGAAVQDNIQEGEEGLLGGKLGDLMSSWGRALHSEPRQRGKSFSGAPSACDRT